MNLLLFGLTLGTVGKLIIGFAVLRVHAYIIKEHRIDGVVLRALQRERYVTLAGISLIIIGYLLEIFFYGGYTDMLSCVGPECAALLDAAIND